MNKLAYVGIYLLLAGSAAAQSVGQKAEALGEKTGINALTGISPTTGDFITKAAISDLFEIQESKLAVDRSDAATKSFATRMIADHQKTSEELKALLAQKTSPGIVPPALDASHQKMIDKLASMNGADFTKQYHSDQVSAHKSAVSLFKRYADGGDVPALKDWATRTLPTLEDHLKMAETLDK